RRGGVAVNGLGLAALYAAFAAVATAVNLGTQALAHALLDAAQNPDERSRRAANAHARIERDFTVHTQVAKIEAILNQVAAAHANRR
ncbi:MAG: hypothetical protein WHT28_11405, partial [Fimbriimonadales bacterium]